MATIIEQELLRHVLSPEWIREIASLAKNEMILAQKSCLFSKLFDSQGETTEREKWEKQKAAGIRLQEIKARERHEMKQFCIEQISLLKKEPENKERIEKKYRLNSEDGREKRLSSEPPRSSPEEKYFTEKRTRAAKKYKKIKREERPPVRRTWEDFSNQLVTSLAANFYVMMRSLYVHYITHQPIEDTEADQHARFYFAQKGELTPHNTTFWRKSIDIEWEIAAERQPLIDRMKKEAQAEGLSEEEMAARIQAWKISDRERKGKELQREWDVLLARQAAEEETHKPKTAEQIAQKEAAAQEAARQKLAYELIEQEAKEKQQRGKEKLQQAHSKKKK